MMLIPALFIDTGMRVSELDGIAIEGIDNQQGRIKLVVSVTRIALC